MKTKILLLFLFASLATIKPTFSQNKDTEPIELLGRTVPHGIPVEMTKDVRNFLVTLYGNEELCNGFIDYVKNSARKDNITLTATYRGNMVEFKAKFDSLEFTYHVWLDPNQDEGPLNVIYYYKGKSLVFDEWIYPRFMPGQRHEVILSALDSKENFDHHAEIVALMMKAGIYIPGPLSSRISYNLLYNKKNIDILCELLKAKTLTVIEDDRQNMTAENGYRKYQIITNGEPEVTFEVTPKW